MNIFALVGGLAGDRTGSAAEGGDRRLRRGAEPEFRRHVHIHPVPRNDMTVREAFNRVGAVEWDALRSRFRDAEQRRAAE